MRYSVKFPSRSIENKFHTDFSNIPKESIKERIMDEVEKLAHKPRPFGRKLFRELKPPIQLYRFTAKYRIRIGDWRVLYDVDDKKKIVWIFVLRKRSERSYKS